MGAMCSIMYTLSRQALHSGFFISRPGDTTKFTVVNEAQPLGLSVTTRCLSLATPATGPDSDLGVGFCFLSVQGVAKMSTSKLQEQTKERLRLVLSSCKVHENFYPDWLVNPETGSLLELDFWLPDIGVAIEVQGRQHYEYVKFFHGNEDGFQAQLRRDQIKRDTCQARSLHLYEIFDEGGIDDFIKDLSGYNKEVANTLLERLRAVRMACHYAGLLWTESNKKRPNKSRMTGLTTKIIKLASKHNFPIKDIRANPGVSKLQTLFPDRPIIKIKKAKGGIVYRTEQAAIFDIDDSNIATVRWSTKEMRESRFDLSTGIELEPDEFMDPWYIRPDWHKPPLVGKYIEVYQKMLVAPFFVENGTTEAVYPWGNKFQEQESHNA